MWQAIHELLQKIYFPKIGIADTIEILIFTILLYYILKHIKDTRMWTVIKGFMLLLLAYIIAFLFSLNAILLIFQNITLVLAVLVVIVFQPEIRKFLENIGSQDYKRTLKFASKTESKELHLSNKTISEISTACKTLSGTKTGALIVIENNIPLNEIIETGIGVHADTTPLHDGAVVIRNNKICAATCYLPLSDNQSINKKYGTRHRAGIGLTEATDALVVIVSEETGNISIAHKGKIKSNSWIYNWFFGGCINNEIRKLFG